MRKLLLTAFGIGVILAVSSPQRAEVADAFLAESGYTDITVMPAKPSTGRGQRRYPFEARSQAGERVSGEVSLGSFAWFYSIKLNDQKPAQ